MCTAFNTYLVEFLCYVYKDRSQDYKALIKIIMKVVSQQILCERIVISHQFQRNLDLVSLLLLEVVFQTLVAFILLRIWGPFPAFGHSGLHVFRTGPHHRIEFAMMSKSNWIGV